MKKGTKFALALGAAAGAVVGSSWLAYDIAFRGDARRQADSHDIPEEDEAYREESVGNIDALMETPYEAVGIRSWDGLKLRGKFYAGEAGKPLLLFFHGYRSTAERDGSGGFSLCREKGWNALMADQRAHGDSEGKTITFGAKERYDVVDWVNWAVRRFGEDQDIYLVGVSMGAATVLMASGLDLPPQVKGVWADCGYSTTEGVLRHMIRRWHLPEPIAFAAVRLGGRLFGGFDVRETTPLEAVKQAKVPILLIHGEGDNVVPHGMAEELRSACAAPVEVVSVPEAHHGMSFYVDNAKYRAAVERLIEGN